MKRPWLAWAAVIVPLWLTMILCTHWEPITRDGWFHVAWHMEHRASPWELASVLRDNWLHFNPRLGQTLTYILFEPGPWHSIITPVIELGLFYVLSALALGRWPSVRRSDDALTYATIFAIAAVCTPEFGAMLFHRPYTGNYLFGLALTALWLVPYRHQLEEPRAHGRWFAAAFFVLGVAAGNCNEHTGPAAFVVAVLAVIVIVRRGERLRAWMLAGLAGLVVGYVLLLVAPGQHERYDHLADQQGTLALIGGRGLVGNLLILVRPIEYLVQALPWVVVALVARGERMSALRWQNIRDALLAALLCTVALIASPKLGPRLYLATTCFAAVALGGWVALSSARRALAALAGTVIALVCIRCIAVYAVLAGESEARVAAITHAKPGDRLALPPLTDNQHWFDLDPLGHRRWFLGDDLIAPAARESLGGNWHVEIRLVPSNDTVRSP